MTAKMRRKGRSIAELYFHGLKIGIVGGCAIRLQDANAPCDSFTTRVPILQYTEWPLLTHQGVPNDITFKEQLTRRSRADLRVRAAHESRNRQRAPECRKRKKFHGRTF